jgi:hypothetical protein
VPIAALLVVQLINIIAEAIINGIALDSMEEILQGLVVIQFLVPGLVVPGVPVNQATSNTDHVHHLQQVVVEETLTQQAKDVLILQS